MAPQAWVTLFAGVLIVGFTAVALIRIIIHLAHVRQVLGTVVVGALVIANQTRPVGPAIAAVNTSLKPVRDFCESV
jgi:hypothetical protein